jgi:ABC-type Mn2+/Zn2+ transport system permease subunit
LLFVETPYDWITVGIFAGLIVLFMQRSTSESNDVDDPLWMYLAAGVGCALANYVGNEGQHLLAILAIVGTLAFVFHYLKPFRWPRAD